MISSQRLIIMYFAIGLCVAIATHINADYENASVSDMTNIMLGFADKAPETSMTRAEMEGSLVDRMDPDHISMQDSAINLLTLGIKLFTFIWNVAIPIPLRAIGGLYHGDILVRVAYSVIIIIRSILSFLIGFEIWLVWRNKKAS